MTVSSTSNRTSVVGNATAGQQITFSFPIATSSELVVIKRLVATGDETILTLTTDYTVTINEDAGGTVTLVSAIASTYHIHIIRVSGRTQTLRLVHGGSFNAENIEDAIDRLTRLVTDYVGTSSSATSQSFGLQHCLHEPVTDTIVGMEIPNRIDRAEAYLYFDASGNTTAVNAFDPGTLAVTPFMETTFLVNANAGAALDDLGFTAKSKSLIALSTNAAWLGSGGLGVTAFAQSLLLDSTAAEARATLDVLGVSNIVCVGDAVVCRDNEVVTI